MLEELKNGTRVRTKKPARESTDWNEQAKQGRRWEAEGEVIARHDSHGVCYEVKHKDGTIGAYERRELQRMDVTAYPKAEREEMLAKMEELAGLFYGRAASIGVHAFIEFAGLMNEFIKVCHNAEVEGIDFTFANTHSGQVLPFQPWHAAYLAEKLNCIFGPALLESEANRRSFIDTLFDGAYKLVPVRE